MAAKAMIHNGCTTGVEAFMLGVPAISYRASVNDRFDFDFHHLPNLISHECFNFDELKTKLKDVLSGADHDSEKNERKSLMQHYLAAQEGPLASDRMIDIIEEMVRNRPNNSQPTVLRRLDGLYRSIKRRIKKRLRGFKAEMSHNLGGFLQYRYPEISPDTLRGRLAQIQRALGMKEKLKLTKQFRKFYRISM
jgi:hypothetical protein